MTGTDISELERSVLDAAMAYAPLKDEYDAHPWEVSALSLLSAEQKLSNAVFELSQANPEPTSTREDPAVAAAQLQRDQTVDMAVARWHETRPNVMPLSEWLGWTPEQYKRWVEDPSQFPTLDLTDD